MNYEFYADVFFLTNFYMDFLAVYAAGEILQQKKKLIRYIVCSALSSLLGCVLFLSASNYDFYLLCVHFMVNPAMIFCCFFPAPKKTYIKAFGLVYFMVLLLGGSVQWMYVTVADGRYYELCLLASAVPVMVFLYILRRKRKNVRFFYQVWIEHQEKAVMLRALYDTGNGLYDPYVKDAVHIVSKGTFEALGGRNAFRTRLIPFSAVGCRQGMLEAFTVERLKIETEDGGILISPAVLAAAEEALFENRTHQMILHSSIHEKMPLKVPEAAYFKDGLPK